MADIQGEIQNRTVALIINVGKAGGKLTASILRAAIRHYMRQRQNPAVHHGKQTVRQLIRQNAGAKSIEINDGNIKSFERVARKYGVDFAMKRDKAAGKYLVFFKGRDEDALTAAFSEYTDRTLRRKTREKPSVRAQLARNKEAIKQQRKAITQHLSKGGMEL